MFIRFVTEAILVAVIIVVCGYVVSVLSAIALPMLALTLAKAVALIVLIYLVRFSVRFIEGVVAETFKKEGE